MPSPVQADPPQPAQWRPDGRLAAVLGALLSVIALGAVVRWALEQRAPRVPAWDENWVWLGAAIAVYLATYVVRGERWHVILVRSGATPKRADSHGLVAVGYAANNVLPARAGDAIRAVLIGPRAATSTRTAVGSLVAERVCDVLVLGVVFAALSVSLLDGRTLDIGGRLATASLVVAAGLVLVAVAAAVLQRRGRLAQLLRFLAPMVRSTRDLRGRHGARVVALTFLIWLVEGTAWWLTAEAVDLGIDPVEAWYLLALATMAMLLPAGPGSVGTLEAAVLLGATALGVAGGSTITYLLLLRFVLVVPIGVVGLMLAATRFGGVRALVRLGRGTV